MEAIIRLRKVGLHVMWFHPATSEKIQNVNMDEVEIRYASYADGESTRNKEKAPSEQFARILIAVESVRVEHGEKVV